MVFTTSFVDILEDPDIDCVLELIGGVTHAKDIVFGAIKAGKHVVTANKALVASVSAGGAHRLLVDVAQFRRCL